MKVFRKNRKKLQSEVVTGEDVVIVPMTLMDAHYDRSAGRYCGHCGHYGSHHTEGHNEFAKAILTSH